MNESWSESRTRSPDLAGAGSGLFFEMRMMKMMRTMKTMKRGRPIGRPLV
jgi:hypothetical protein